MRLMSVDAMDAGRHAWRCVKKKELYTGRIYTHGDAVLKQTKLHIHEPDYTDCEVKEIYSESKSLDASSSAKPSDILINHKKHASEAAKLKLPECPTWKHALHHVRRLENPTPLAPTSFAETILVPEEIVSFKQ